MPRLHIVCDKSKMMSFEQIEIAQTLSSRIFVREKCIRKVYLISIENKHTELQITKQEFHLFMSTSQHVSIDEVIDDKCIASLEAKLSFKRGEPS